VILVCTIGLPPRMHPIFAPGYNIETEVLLLC
jgi:hypothetical protein